MYHLQVSILLSALATFSLASITINFTNQCHSDIWVGGMGSTLSPDQSGLHLPKGTTQSLNLRTPLTAGRFWGRTGCTKTATGLVCESGDCGGQEKCHSTSGQPATLFELTVDSQITYDISNVDGFNLPMRVSVGNEDGNRCKSIECTSMKLGMCPRDLQILNAREEVVACMSMCKGIDDAPHREKSASLSSMFKQDSAVRDLVCCMGQYGTPDKCNVKAWPSLDGVNMQSMIKQLCPDAYSYAYDDLTSTFICDLNTKEFTVTFC